MLFSSLTFLYAYLPIVLLVYYACPKRYRNGCLFLVSLVFYGWGEPLYISIMILSTLVDYFNGRMVHKYRYQRTIARRFVICSVVFNIGLLAFFKYYFFIASNLQALFQTEILPVFSVALPIGISFYSFQTMSYPIDVYRQEAPVQTSMVAFGTYVTMFPQLIAGPIVRYQDIAQQLTTRSYTMELFYQGILRFVIGLGKKVVIANQIGLLWEDVSHLPINEVTTLMSWLGITAFALQLYFDFSAYSDMAIGLGKMLGFQLPENFHYPFLSKSMSEFWRRWHMTLGTWFKQYVYLPLGGSRKGMPRTIINLLIVWFLTGFWHGASWNFVLWGLYCGIVIILEKLFLLHWLKRFPSWIAHCYFLVAIFFGWLLFAFEDLSQAAAFATLALGLSSTSFLDARSLYLLAINLPLLIIAVLGATPIVKTFFIKHQEHPVLLWITPVFVVGTLLLCTSLITADSYNPFLYFRF